MSELVAWIGSIAFAVCGIPPAWHAFKTKSCEYSWAFLVLWALGEVCYLVYTALTQQWVLWLNYAPNALCLGVIAYYNRGIR